MKSITGLQSIEDVRCGSYRNQSVISSFDEMDSIDLSADLTALPTNTATRLLSESPLVGTSSSNRSNLSSSELVSVHDLPAGDRSTGEAENDERDEDEIEGDLRDEEDGGGEEDEIRKARKAARTREEKLQNDLFLLKKLNSAFSLYTDALRTTQSSTEVSGYYPVPSLFVMTGVWEVLEVESSTEGHERVVGFVYRDAGSFGSSD